MYQLKWINLNEFEHVLIFYGLVIPINRVAIHNFLFDLIKEK